MSKNPRIIFFGNSKYSVINALALSEHFRLSAIVTVSDSINPRTREPIQSPAKLFAIAHNIFLIETNALTPEAVEKIKSLSPDFLVVADYGLILPASLLAIPAYAPLNVHHSLLPKYRGPAPAPAAIVNGDTLSGVSIIVMTDTVDAGDILKQVSYALKPNETANSLLTVLNTLGARAVIEVIDEYLIGATHPVKQDEAKATFTRYMTRNDGLIDLLDDPETNWRKIRAYEGWPGTFFVAAHRGRKMRVKITRASFEGGILSIQRVVPENKKEMGYEDFVRGLKT